MKYLFLPFTLIIWYFLSYWGFYFSFVGITYIFSLNWFWLILFYPILLSLLGLLTGSLPSLLGYLILNRLYYYRLFFVILHSIIGILGITDGVLLISKLDFSLLAFWNESWLKVLLLGFPFVAIIFGIIWAVVISPFVVRNKIKEKENYGYQ